MSHKAGPSERRTCTRCGLTRVRNGGLKRRAKETGLCRDCWFSIEWTCPACLSTMSQSAKGIHLKHSHGLSLADVDPV